MKLKVKKLHPDAQLPKRAKVGDAGYDIIALNDGVWDKTNSIFIQYETGLAIEPEIGYHVEIFPRSSISRTDLILANCIGLVDNGYRGELLIRFKPTSIPETKEDWHNGMMLYKKGDKIAQLVIRKTTEAEIEEVLELSETDRGSGGFGSSGS